MLGPRMTKLSCAVVALACSVQALVDPTEVYNGGFNSTDTEVLLRIATGGAGQSGLVRGICSFLFDGI